MTPQTTDYYITPETQPDRQQSQGENPDPANLDQSQSRDDDVD